MGSVGAWPLSRHHIPGTNCHPYKSSFSAVADCIFCQLLSIVHRISTSTLTNVDCQLHICWDQQCQPHLFKQFSQGLLKVALSKAHSVSGCAGGYVYFLDLWYSLAFLIITVRCHSHRTWEDDDVATSDSTYKLLMFFNLFILGSFRECSIINRFSLGVYKLVFQLARIVTILSVGNTHTKEEKISFNNPWTKF